MQFQDSIVWLKLHLTHVHTRLSKWNPRIHSTVYHRDRADLAPLQAYKCKWNIFDASVNNTHYYSTTVSFSHKWNYVLVKFQSRTLVHFARELGKQFFLCVDLSVSASCVELAQYLERTKHTQQQSQTAQFNANATFTSCKDEWLIE